MQPEDLYRLHFVDDVALSPDGRRVAHVVTVLEPEAPRPRIFVDGRFFTSGSTPRWSPDGTRIAFLHEGRLHVSDSDRPTARRLSDEEASAAHWSPNGKALLFARHEAPTQAPRVITDAWQKADGQGLLRRSHLCVASLDGDVRRITDGFDITPAWSPDGRHVAFARMREHGHSLSDIFVADADGSNPRRITQEVTRARCPSWSPDGRRIAFYGVASDPRFFGDPMLVLWVTDLDGRTSRVDLGDRAVGFVPPQYVESGPVWVGERLLVPVTARGCVDLVEVDAEQGVLATVTGGRHVGGYSAAGGRVAWIEGDARDPGDVYVDGKRFTESNKGVLDALPPVASRVFETPNGEAQGWVYGAGYGPLLLDVHGGPHSFTGNAFSYGHFYRYVMAAQGWTVLALNPTGSGSYGAAFASGIRGRWGEHDLPEHLAAIDALIADGLADPARQCITGYSYGGYMTCWALTQTDRFKVGVAGGAVTNLESFYGTSDIGPWFGTYEMQGELADTRETYRRLSPVQYADRVRAPLLLLHGEDDQRCPIGQSEEFFTALAVARTVPCTLVRYPAATHLLPYKGKPAFRVDYTRRLMAWVTRYSGS